MALIAGGLGTLASLSGPVRAQTGQTQVPRSPSAALVEVVERATPSLVAVSRGDHDGGGFTFFASDLVVTSLYLATRDGRLAVTGSDGVARSATLVAWDGDADLALLALSGPVPGRPLQVAPACDARVGQAVVVPGAATLQARREDQPRRVVGAANFGQVALRDGGLLVLDAHTSITGGAPVLDERGRVLAVARWLTTADGRPQAACAQGLPSLLERRGKQPAPPVVVERRTVVGFSGFLSSSAEDGFPDRETAGLTVEVGDRWGWFALIGRLGVGTGWEPVGVVTSESRKRFLSQLEALAQWDLHWYFRPALGLGAGYQEDSVRRWGAAQSVLPSVSSETRRRVQPHVRLSLMTTRLEASLAVQFIGPPQATMAFGLTWGR